MELKGKFDPSFLGSILQLLSNDKKSGVLKLSNNEEDVNIYLNQGVVIHASGSARETRLGRFLIRKGVIDESQLNEAIGISNQSGQALGKILINSGYITPQVLKKAIFNQTKELIFSLFLWKSGEFEYEECAVNPDGMVMTNLNIMSIVMEASRRIDEMSVISRQIPSDRCVFRVSRNARNQGEIKFKANEWHIFSLIDGKSIVRELIDNSGYDDFSAYKILYSLVSSGIIEKAGELPEAGTAVSQSHQIVISLYHNIFQSIRRHILSEIGNRPYTVLEKPGGVKPCMETDRIRNLRKKQLEKWTDSIFEDNKTSKDPKTVDLLRKFKPNRPIDEYSSLIDDSLKSLFAEPEEARAFLLNGLNEFLENTLFRISTILNPDTMQSIVDDISRMKGSIYKAKISLIEKNDITAGIERIIEPVQQIVLEDISSKRKTGGIFAIFEDSP